MATPAEAVIRDMTLRAYQAAPIGLVALEEEVREQVEVLSYPATPWTRQASDTDDRFDVIVVGAGQAGLTTAAKLKREGVARVLVVDREPAGREGPWVTWARMETLRTQKDLHGPDAGVPAASFRAWYIAQHGHRAWRELALIPRRDWMAYLMWIRRIFRIEVRNSATVIDLVSDGETAVLHIESRGHAELLSARAVVITTGIGGYGGARIPDLVAGLPRERWMHSSDPLGPGSLEGRRVAVLGAGASAFDNAAAALEDGAGRVVQLCRRNALATVNVMRSWETRGAFRHFAHMPEDLRLNFARQFLTYPAPPPDHSVARCEAYPDYELKLGAAVVEATEIDGGLRLTLADGTTEETDLLILGTGFVVDLEAVPWLGSIRSDLALWGDRAGDRLDPGDPVDAALAKYPCLDEGMRCLGRDAAASERVGNIYLYGAAGLPSVGPQCSGINTLPVGSETVVTAVCRRLFTDRAAALVDAFIASTTEPGTDDEAAVPPGEDQ